MKNWSAFLITAAATVLAFLMPTSLFAAGKEAAKIDSAIEVLEQIMAIPEKSIPPQLLANAQGIAIIPNVIKVGFVLGGRHGKGILFVRDKRAGWSNPSFVALTGGSFGWQIGAQSTDVILVFKTGRSVEGIMKGKFTLGADAGVAAGPVGRRVEAATDAQLKSEIYSYSRSRGLFAGVSLEGSVLQIDDSANAVFYGREGIRAGDIFVNEGIPVSDSVSQLKKKLAKYASIRGF